jgi:DNA-binding LacI/PurR family transcriptional regulator
MTNRPTIADLARELGLSKSAVSNALRGVPLVSAETTVRVQEYARARGWRPNAAARALSLARSDNIGVVLVQVDHLLGTEPFYMNAIAGIERALSPNGKNLLLRTIDSPDDERSVYESWVTEGRVDGVILFDRLVDDPRPQFLDEHELPYAVFGDAGEHSLLELVREEAKTIVEHIADLGHTSVLFIGGPQELAHEVERSAQVARIIDESGMTAAYRSSEYSIEGGRRELRAALASGGFTAVAASSDLIAIGAATELAAEGRDDVAVVSWDDSILCQYGARPLTALERRHSEFGEIAARTLLNQTYSLGLQEIAPRPIELTVRESSIRRHAEVA